MQQLYFSFIGFCTGKQVFEEIFEDGRSIDSEGEMPSLGEMIHHVGSIAIFNSPHPKYVVVVADKDLYPMVYRNAYLVKRNSFDCNPAVPVSSFGQELRAALSH